MSGEEKASSLGSLLGGACAAMCVDSIIFPLDTIKTRSQAEGGLVKNGGYKHLYRGIGSVVVCTIPSAATFFYGYEKLKAAVPWAHTAPAANHLVASSLAEALSCIVLAPAEVVKQRAQVSSGTQHNSRQILRDLLAGRDWDNLRKSYYGLLARNVPVTAIQFMLYEAAKTRYRARKWDERHPGQSRDNVDYKEINKIRLGALESGLCAAASGSFAALITTPLDVTKTKVMLAQNDKDAHSTILTVGRRLVRDGGWTALFKGVHLRVFWTGLGLSLYLGSYEAIKGYVDG
ncbi:hypothetical protein PYCC9005_001825 [Savitreella phatthalungensis]